jgi:hypothetical protein
MAARFSKILLAALLAIVGIVLVLCAALLTAPVQTAVARRVLTSVNENLVGHLKLGKVHVLPSGRLLLCDLDLADSSGTRILHVDTLMARVSVRSLLHDSVHVRSARATGITSSLWFDSAGHSNVERALTPRRPSPPTQKTTKPSPWVICVDTVLLRGGPTTVQWQNGTSYRTESWQADARVAFGHDTLNHALSFVSPQQINLTTTGVTVLSNPPRLTSGALSVTLDSSFVASLPPPVSSVGELKTHVEYRAIKDSLKISARLSSGTIGDMRAQAAVLYPLKDIAFRGDIELVHLTPSVLLPTKANIEINGQLHIEKKVTRCLLDGWHVQGNLQDCRYDRYRLTEGVLDINTADSTATLHGAVAGNWGSAAFCGSLHGYDLERASADAYVNFERIRVSTFVRGPADSLAPLTGVLHVFAPSLNVQHPHASVILELGPTGLGTYAVDTVSLRAQISDQHFTLDSLYAKRANSEVMARAEGVVGDSVHFSVRGRVPDLHELQTAFGRALPKLDSLWGAVHMDVSGSASLQNNRVRHLMASGFVSLDSAGYGDKTLEHAELMIQHANVDSLSAAGDFRLRGLRALGQTLDSLRLLGTISPRTFAGQLYLSAKSDTIVLATKVNVDYTPQRTQLKLTDFTARAYGIAWAADGETSLLLSGSRLEVDALTLRSNVGVLRATGTLMKGGTQDFVIELSGMRTEEIGRVFKKSVPASVTNLRLELTGPDTALAGDISITADSVRSGRTIIADEIALHATTSPRGTAVEGWIMLFGDTLTVFDGELPAQLSFNEVFVLRKDQAMRGHVRLLRQPLSKLDRYLPFGTTLGGFISGDVTFSGTPAQPDWGGTFQIEDGKYFDSRFGVRYDKIRLQGEFAGDTLRIPSFSLRSTGTLSGTGWAVMAFPLPTEVHLNVRSNLFDVVDGPAMRVRASGNLTVNGPPQHLNADGRLQLSNVQYRITQSTTKKLEDIDLEGELARLRGDTTQKAVFLPSQLYRGMTHSFALDLLGNCWLRGGGLNLELAGKLFLNKETGQMPTIIGDIDVRQGTVQFLRDQFKVSEDATNKVTFDGPASDPILDVTAYHTRWKAQGYDIILRLTGRASTAKMELSGTNPTHGEMTQEEIVMLLLFGRMAQPGSSSGAAGEVQAAIERTASSGLSSLMSRWSGVDVFQYDPGEGGLSNLTGGSLEVGSYVTDRLFVRVRQPIEVTQFGQEVTVEYRFLNWLRLQARQTGKESSALDLFLQIDWR